MTEDMGKTYFSCPRCGWWRVVEARGVVLSGPACKHCKAQMRPVKVKQLDLGLFNQSADKIGR